MNAYESVLTFLLKHRRNIIHTIDPFKVRYLDGLDKVEFLGRVSPFVLVGSTDCPDFAFVSEYIADLKKKSGATIFTHFLPQPGKGYPVSFHADGFFATSVTNSQSSYLACCKPTKEPLKETTLRHPGARYVNVSAVTIGEDQKSAEFAHTFTVAAEQQQVLELLCRHSEEQVECYYVFSRNRALDPSLIRAVRRSVGPHAIIFASGCIVHRDQADALLEAGADYAVVGSALELADWRGAAERIFLARETVDSGQWQEKRVLSEPA
jgi:putative glycerol-1-phosphate prenyltransferase